MGKTVFLATELWIFKTVLKCELSKLRWEPYSAHSLWQTVAISLCVEQFGLQENSRELFGQFIIQYCVKILSENSGLQKFFTKISTCIKLAGRNKHGVYFVIL